jgi:hypothetical protein
MAETEHNDRTKEERSDSFWHRVYAAVVVTTFLVVTLLWGFSKYFSAK